MRMEMESLAATVVQYTQRRMHVHDMKSSAVKGLQLWD